MAIQTEYSRHQKAGFHGDVSRPVPPVVYDTGQVSVAVKPGWAVLYDASADKWRIPTTDAERLDVVGIVSFDSGVRANSNGVIEFEADDVIKIGVTGHFWAKAGEALEYGDLVVFDHGADKDWIKYTRTIEDIDVTAPDDYSGTVNAAGVSTYVQGAINGIEGDVSDYVRSAILTLPRAPVVAVSKAPSGGLVELRLSGALVR